MSRKNDIEEIIEHIEGFLSIIDQQLSDSITNDTINTISPVQIKNAIENVRSCLDYIAHDIISITGVTPPNKIYYPYGKTEADMLKINKWLNKINNTHTDIYNAILETQDFKLPADKAWLFSLCTINIDVKHKQLERVERQESKKFFNLGGTSVFSSGVSIGSYTRVQDGVKATVENIDFTTSLTAKDIQDKFKSAGMDIDVQTQSDGVSFLTKSGCDVIKLIRNAVFSIRELVKKIYP